jgi:hypothetical protein
MNTRATEVVYQVSKTSFSPIIVSGPCPEVSQNKNRAQDISLYGYCMGIGELNEPEETRE